jgi:hypothetical protein
VHEHVAYRSLHPMHCIYVGVSYFAIDHTEQGREEPPEPARIEGGKNEQDHGKPRCNTPKSLSFIFEHYL